MSEVRVVLTRNRAFTLGELQMRSDAREVPSPLGRTEAVTSRWIARAQFMGSADDLDGGTSDARADGVEGLVALAVTEQRLIGILGPIDDEAVSVWFSVRRDAISIQVDGSKGVFKKRPAAIGVDFGDERAVLLLQVSQIFERSRRYQTGRENGLLAALEAPAGAA